MKFNTREDIKAPIDFVFEQITDFAAFERSVMRRGGDVDRIAIGGADGLDAQWRVKFQMRGVERDVTATITEAKKPTLIKMVVTSRSADADMLIELISLSNSRTRLSVHVESVAKTIATKILFKSIRFAKQKSDGRFKAVVASFAVDIEKRYRA